MLIGFFNVWVLSKLYTGFYLLRGPWDVVTRVMITNKVTFTEILQVALLKGFDGKLATQCKERQGTLTRDA